MAVKKDVAFLLEQDPKRTNSDLYILLQADTDSKKSCVRKAKQQVLLDLENESTDKIIQVIQHKSVKLKKVVKQVIQHKQDIDDINFIDDPDELLISVCIRELNKARPDPRWASILINVRKESLGMSKKEGEIQSKFKSMQIHDIVKIISEKARNTLPMLDLTESS